MNEIGGIGNVRKISAPAEHGARQTGSQRTYHVNIPQPNRRRNEDSRSKVLCRFYGISVIRELAISLQQNVRSLAFL